MLEYIFVISGFSLVHFDLLMGLMDVLTLTFMSSSSASSRTRSGSILNDLLLRHSEAIDLTTPNQNKSLL